MINSDPDLLAVLPSWELALESAGRSPKTITAYFDSVHRLAAYLAREKLPAGTPAIRGFLAAERKRTSPESSQKHFRHLHAFYGWMENEGDLIAANPMRRVEKPKVPVRAKPFFTQEDIVALLAVTKGADFEGRRDHAIIRIFIDTGVRVSGLAGLRFEPADISLRERRMKIILKGGNEHWVPLGSKSCAAVDRYLRVRARHSRSGSPWLWLGTRGHGIDHLGASGIAQMLTRRGDQAGVADCHAHRFRHTFSDAWLASGGNVDDLMNIAGWSTIAMPLRYAKGRGAARAAEAHRRLSPGDRV